MKTMLYAAKVTALADERLYRAAYEAAPPGRRAKADRYLFPKDRYLSLGVSLLLAYALRENGAEFSEEKILKGSDGKPDFGEGRWHFNLSHSEEYALCALSECEVGCDIEKIKDADLHLADRFFCRDEFEDIALQEGAAQNERFFRYWTLKESFMKVTGLGMKLPLHDFSVSLRGEGVSVRQSVNDKTYSFAEFSDITGYQCAVCTEGEPGEVLFRELSVRELLEVNV